MAYSARPVGHWVQAKPAAPVVPAVPEVQTTLPTSAYGQTIPVVYGKCRLPAAYIWVPPILTITSTHTEWWDTITTTTAKMSCRLRFARPLVPNSTWTMRKLYANGKLIYDATQGYRQSGLKFTAYDGRSTQPRDPTMVSAEGETNVSAHRGYLDIVVKDFDIIGLGSPPVFEAEWIQDGAATHVYDTFTTFSGSIFFSSMIPVWDQGKLFGFNWSDIFLYSIFATRQYFTFDLPGDAFTTYSVFRYSRALDRLVYLASFGGAASWQPVLIDGSTGTVIETSSTSAITTGIIAEQSGCLVDLSASSALVVGFTTNSDQIFSVLVTATDITPVYQSATSWGGYASIQCVTPGAVRGSDADFWFCADADLVKVTLTSQGTLKSVTVLATFSDDLRYAIYDDDGDLVVWTDAATVKRINGTTGAVEYTKTVPYQIETISLRNLGPPDLQRLTEDFYFTIGGTSYLTDLKTGVTRSFTGATSNAPFFYDGQTETAITKTTLGQPRRLRLIVGDGTQRQLTDFLQALMEAGGFAPEEIAFEGNIDDLIDGAVIDITASVREIARSVCEPYSIAMFER